MACFPTSASSLQNASPAPPISAAAPEQFVVILNYRILARLIDVPFPCDGVSHNLCLTGEQRPVSNRHLPGTYCRSNLGDDLLKVTSAAVPRSSPSLSAAMKITFSASASPR